MPKKVSRNLREVATSILWWGDTMSLQFSCDALDTSLSEKAKIDNLYFPDLPMLHFAQKVTQNKKYSYHVTYHATPKSLEQFLRDVSFQIPSILKF